MQYYNLFYYQQLRAYRYIYTGISLLFKFLFQIDLLNTKYLDKEIMVTFDIMCCN